MSATHQPSLFEIERDICAERHGGNPESREAFERARGRIGEMHRLILNYLAENGEATGKELAVVFGKPFNQISGRFSELKQKGYIVPTGRRRDGSAVLRLALRLTPRVPAFPQGELPVGNSRP